MGGQPALRRHRHRRPARPDAQARDETSDGNLIPGREGGELNDDSDDEDCALDRHGVLAAHAIGKRCCVRTS